jgi:outer membrane protein OmpA-like peptidoglycan-associated protein/ABC-type nitrate/sulfonate/bicarbonate transport system substrate-binding protein
MSDSRSKGILLAAILWCVILGVLAVAYKFLVHPYFSEKLKGETSSASLYKDEIVVAADSFSGYAILRSDLVKQELKAKKIKLTIQDDKADYEARIKALQSGQAQMAVFTIDSLITAGAKLGDFPASIVLVIDETKGGDAIVAPPGAVTSLQSLNDPSAQLVLTPNSPSEFLARVVIAHFNLPNLPAKWALEANGAAEVYKKFAAAGPAEKKGFVLWEPYVSKALQKPGAQILLDSSKLKGYIVDVLVAERAFLRDHSDLVQAVVEAHCRANYTLAQKPDGFTKLVAEDARLTGSENLSEAQAAKVVQGIQWKNTLENYGHFGLLDRAAQGDVPYLEDSIANIIDVLIKTKGLAKDPLAGKQNTLFYSQVLSAMKSAHFHPGRNLNILSGADTGQADEKVRADKQLGALSGEQWNTLRPVGQFRIDPIVFRRGSADVSEQSQRDLQELARRLRSYPQFYLRVVGQTRAEGDPEANRQLAQARAEAAAQALTASGINADRVRTEAVPSASASGEAQSVTFIVGQLPY